MDDRGAHAERGDRDLVAKLETRLPRSLPVGRSTAVFCLGTCFHRRRRIERVEVLVDEARHPTTASRMPRFDLFRALHPTLSADQEALADSDPGSAQDPELRCYRSGFWTTVPILSRDHPGEIGLRLEARLADGDVASAVLGTIEVVEADEPAELGQAGDRAGQGLIAVCMATFDPDPELFRIQVDSLRGQTDENWVCLVADDCSRPDRFEVIEQAIADDRRFIVSRSERNVGFYRNFERALGMVPDHASLVALCDHDDRWYPDKLETLRGALGDARLVYSDQRLVDADGHVRADSLWQGRRNNHTNFASMLIANTITGAATLFRRDLIDRALPFPDGPGWEFHDQWLGLVAMATGRIAYVDRPLYDYVQHSEAVVGKVSVSAPGAASDGTRGPRSRVSRLRGLVYGWRAAVYDRWRAVYFCAYLQLASQAEVLLARCSQELTPRKRRALRRLISIERSPLGFAWLVMRPIRELFGRNETLGTEWLLARGILWRHLIALRTGRRERPNGLTHDASMPPFEPDLIGQRRIRRWRARR